MDALCILLLLVLMLVLQHTKSDEFDTTERKANKIR